MDGGGGAGGSGAGAAGGRSSTVFREIHKNTWLKRLTADNKKLLVGPKKSERSWVVFCVHDDCEALLEGYHEPRAAAQHQPDWTVALQHARHVSHSLVPTEQEYEFVVTLPTEVVRFIAPTWDCMQEWVDTLRQKLREMRIMSPKENLYSRMPEMRPPLAPTRDPQSPLPPPPPVPAALVPGIERIAPLAVALPVAVSTATTTGNSTPAAAETTAASREAPVTSSSASTSSQQAAAASSTSMPASAMSNTLTQNLINMLSNPVVSAYQQSQSQPPSATAAAQAAASESLVDSFFAEDDDDDDDDNADADGDVALGAENAANSADDGAVSCDEDVSSRQGTAHSETLSGPAEQHLGAAAMATATSTAPPSMARIFADNVLADPNTCPSAASAETKTVRTEGTARSAGQTDLETSSCDSLGSAAEAEAEAAASVFQTEPIIIPRPQTSRSSARDKHSAKPRRPATAKLSSTSTSTSTAASSASATSTVRVMPEPISLGKPTAPAAEAASATSTASTTNITIIQVSSPLVKPSATDTAFQFPSAAASATKIELADDQYKSNVQIIPSNPCNTTVITGCTSSSASASSCSSTTEQVTIATSSSSSSSNATQPQPVTTVQVSGVDPIDSAGAVGYGRLKRLQPDPAVTTIPVGSASSTTASASASSATSSGPTPLHYEPLFTASSAAIAKLPAASHSPKPVPKLRTTVTSHHQQQPMLRRAAAATATSNNSVTVSGPSTTSAGVASAARGTTTTSIAPAASSHQSSNNNHIASAAPQQPPSQSTTTAGSASSAIPNGSNGVESPASTNTGTTATAKLVRNISSPLPAIRKLLTRGLTDLSIQRPSRSREPQTAAPPQPAPHSANRSPPAAAAAAVQQRTARPPAAQLAEHQQQQQQRRRSSSHSEAQRATGRQQQAQVQQRHNNNNNGEQQQAQQHPSTSSSSARPLLLGAKHSAPAGASGSASAAGAGGGQPAGGGGSRLTMREQQVLELRKEMRHMGGVRIQLRRKDCQGTIALCDAFGAVWVCGWKQKEHPMLYYALHIGDQVVQVAGCAVSSQADVQRIVRNVQGLYIDFILRRLPFGRVYAIRRELDGQCLGLIRDGNTATIVDVVPKSLSARHGLPPKAQSCDGLSLTFWVLTEINGRPLNLFFKENEVRDRLNVSGRDISVLVQPADLIAKLKKHLKSMRGYKDYIVQ